MYAHSLIRLVIILLEDKDKANHVRGDIHSFPFPLRSINVLHVRYPEVES